MKALKAIQAAGLDTHPDVMSWLEILPDRDSFINSLSDTIPFLVYIYDLEKATFIYFNRHFIEFTGYSRDELYSMGTDGFAIICHHEDMPNLLAFRQQIEDAKDQDVLKLGYRMVCKSGEAFWLHSQIKIIARNKSGQVTQFMGVSQDISQIKEIEDLLIRQENIYSNILEYIPTDIAVLDIEGSYRYVNPWGKKDPQIKQWMLGKSDADLFTFQGRDKNLSHQRLEAFSTAIETKKSIQFEEEWLQANGSIQSTLRSYFPVLDAQQNILMVIGYGMDISDRRDSERKLKQREIRFKYLVEHGTDVFLQMDIEGRISYSNPRASELTGYGADSLRQMRLVDLVRVDHRDKVIDAFAQSSQKSIYLEFPIKTMAGVEKWIGQNLQQYCDEAGNLVIQSLARDITDNKQILAQLEEKKIRLEEAFQIGKIGSFDLYFEPEQIFWSEQTFAIFGFDPNRVVPTSQIVLNQVHPDDIERTIRTVEEAYQNRTSFELEYRFLAADGSIKYLISRGKPIIIKGQLERISGTIIDITVLREAAELSLKAKMLAEEAIRTKELFLAKVSHELKTPMHGIIGLSNLLLETPLSQQQQKFAKAIHDSSKNLEFVLKDILDFSKMEAGKMNIESIPFDLNEVIKSICNALAFNAREKGIDLILHELPQITSNLAGDPYRVSQILQNLINNAIKFTENGAVSVSLEVLSKDEAILVTKITIADTGIGIHSQFLESIFDDFVQASDDTTRRYGGTGLGLAICKHLASLMHGSINVNSTLGVGSSFVFEIPFSLPKLPLLEPQVANVKKYSIPLKILLVDDNEVNLLITQTMLEKHGFQIDLADDGTTAIDLIEGRTFDLVLMDIQMPLMDGIEASHRIRKLPNCKVAQTPIIAISAQKLPDFDTSLFEPDFSAFLEKPFSEIELLQSIEVVMNQMQGRSASVALDDTVIKSYSWDQLQKISNGDRGFLRKMGTLYLSSISDSVKRLEKAFLQNNLPQIKFEIHKMKPGIRHFDMDEILDFLEGIDKSAEADHSRAEAGTLIELLKSKLTEINLEIKSDLDKMELMLH